MTSAGTDIHPAAGASLIALLAGLWLFISPWVYGSYGNSNAWNCWITGALIFIFGLIRMNRPAATGLSWSNAVLGIWTFVSPWVCGDGAHPGHLVNSLFVGIIVFCAAIAGANSDRMSHDRTSTA
jgi:SPW repeat